MGSEFKFFDYFDADGSGTNIIKDWLNGEARLAKMHFDSVIRNLRNSSPTSSQGSVWSSPKYIVHLHNEWKGFIEIKRRAKRIQFRLIGRVEDRTVFLVTWGYHQGDWAPGITPQKAWERVYQMKNSPAIYRREHDFG